MYVRITKDRPRGLYVERDNARAAKRLDPARILPAVRQLVNILHQFGFDSLTLDGWDPGRGLHDIASPFSASSAAAKSSSPRSSISRSCSRNVSIPRFLYAR